MVMSDSPEAATRVTITGWVSRHGRFYGEDERIAPYDGCTHRPCEDCGKPTEKCSIVSRSARVKRDVVRYAALPAVPWDGTQMIFAEAADEYFSDLESFLDHCEGDGIDPATLRPLLCEPNYAHEVDPDYWCDELPEDGDLPGEIEKALESLNAVIRKHKFVLSWSPGKTRLALEERVAETGDSCSGSVTDSIDVPIALETSDE